MFFDDHPEFLETSRTAATKGRLNLRHLAIIEQNEDILRGRSVVDIASHDGRWSHAALEAGADHVRIRSTDWPGLLAQHPEIRAVGQYADGSRVTFRAEKRPR